MRGRLAPWTAKRRFRRVSHGHDGPRRSMKARSRLRSVLYSAATMLVALVVLEIGASWLMLVYYRATHQQNFETYDTSYLSVVNLARRFSQLVGLSEPAMVLERLAVTLLPRRSAAGLQRRARPLHPFLRPPERLHRRVGILSQQGDDQSRRLALCRRAAAGQAHRLHLRRQLGIRQRRARRTPPSPAASTRRCPTGTCACWRWAAIR